MKITVFGASGATGSKVVELAAVYGHEVVAVVRRAQCAAPSDRIIVRQGDVLDPASVNSAIASSEVIISCIGPAKNLAPGTLMSRGVTNMVGACERAGIRRFVFQSGILMSDGSELSPANRLALRALRFVFANSVQDKRIAEESIQHSRLDWVIVRPAGLTDAPARTKYTAGPRARISPLLALPFVNCAECLVRAATEIDWTNQVINVGR